MSYLSWLFFCLSPFALFCTEDGNGLIMCPVFIMLGFIFKWASNNTNSTTRAVVKVSPQEFWEWHYKDRISSTLAEKDSVSDSFIAYKDQEARKWATTICGYHNAWVPPESKQEQIARSNGVVTEQMVKAKEVNKDRVQIGKYFLMTELEEKYRSTQIGKGGRENCCFPRMHIEEDKYKIKSSDDRLISDYWIKGKYNKSISEIWESLSYEEKTQATKWIEEYEEKLIRLCNEYVYGELYDIDVKIDF